MICALKKIGGPVVVYDVPDPKALFEENCNDASKVTHIGSKDSRFAALTHVTPDLDDGINMQLDGTLLYGTVVFVCVDEAEELHSLLPKQLEQLSLCTKVVLEGEGM